MEGDTVPFFSLLNFSLSGLDFIHAWDTWRNAIFPLKKLGEMLGIHHILCGKLKLKIFTGVLSGLSCWHATGPEAQYTRPCSSTGITHILPADVSRSQFIQNEE